MCRAVSANIAVRAFSVDTKSRPADPLGAILLATIAHENRNTGSGLATSLRRFTRNDPWHHRIHFETAYDVFGHAADTDALKVLLTEPG